MDPIYKTVGQVFIGVLCMLLIKRWLIQIDERLKSVNNKLDSKTDETQCTERREVLCRKIKRVEDETQDQWGVINCHGHRGLDGDNNQVVRLGG